MNSSPIALRDNITSGSLTAIQIDCPGTAVYLTGPCADGRRGIIQRKRTALCRHFSIRAIYNPIVNNKRSSRIGINTIRIRFSRFIQILARIGAIIRLHTKRTSINEECCSQERRGFVFLHSFSPLSQIGRPAGRKDGYVILILPLDVLFSIYFTFF